MIAEMREVVLVEVGVEADAAVAKAILALLVQSLSMIL
jgi:hypothetical protein